MHSCTDPHCGHDHSHSRNRPLPVTEDDARTIDEARRALKARATGTPMAPAPDVLDMATREIDIPTGERTMEINSIMVTFKKESLAARVKIASYLQARFNTLVRPKRAGLRKLWQFDIIDTVHMDFQSLVVTLQSVNGMGDIELTRVDGLYEHGIYVIDVDSQGVPAFRLCGDRHIEPRAS